MSFGGWEKVEHAPVIPILLVDPGCHEGHVPFQGCIQNRGSFERGVKQTMRSFIFQDAENIRFSVLGISGIGSIDWETFGTVQTELFSADTLSCGTPLVYQWRPTPLLRDIPDDETPS